MISHHFHPRIFPSLFLSLFLFLHSPSARAVDHLSNPLADPPKWKLLEKYQRTITHDEFERLLRTVYCSHGISENFIRLDRDFACILMDRDAQTWFTNAEAGPRRLADYRSRLSRALAQARAGDGRFVASPRVDSYHGIWFELHEDLIGLAGRTREAEVEAGRA